MNHEALRIDRGRHVVVARDLDLGATRELPYDALMFSTGARPVRPQYPASSVPSRCATSRTPTPWSPRLRDARTAVVVGGGFIGIEVAENLVHRGLDVALVEAADQVMAPLDPEMAPWSTTPDQHGVDLRLGDGLRAIGADDVQLSEGVSPGRPRRGRHRRAPRDAAGRGAGLATGLPWRHRRRRELRTSDPAIFAVGDAVEKTDAVDRSATLVPLANTANLQGRRAADVIAGLAARDRPVLGTAIVGVFAPGRHDRLEREAAAGRRRDRTGSSTPTRHPTPRTTRGPTTWP